MMRRLLLVVALGVLGAVVVAPAAHAAVGAHEWESLTCKENADLPAPLPEKFGKPEVGTEKLLPEPPGECKGSTPEKLFTQAAGHPNYGITDFKIDTYPSLFGLGGFPTAFLKDIVVDTPEGLSVNPEALPQCEVAQLAKAACPPTSLVGVNYLTVAAQSPNAENKCTSPPSPVAGECLQARVALPVYNLVPFQGVPSMVGFLTESGPTFIVGSLSPVDQHVTFTISDIHPPSATSPPIIGSRLVFFSARETNVFNPAADGTYLTMPSNCAGGQVSTLHLDTQGNVPPETEPSSTEASYTTPTGASGCANVPFNPEITVTADGAKLVDSPEPTTVDVGIPWDPAAPIANSYLKVAKVTLPDGMGINPSASNGLEACTDEQFHYHTALPVECPEASRIGTVEIQTPSLPPDSINGSVYVGEPLKNGPGAFETGEQFRIFIYGFSTRYGVNVRLEGKVFPNKETGRLTAVVAENPQATFRNFRLHFFGGDRGILTSPPTCGTNTTTTEFTPWSGNPDHNTPSTNTALTGVPGGGDCPTSLGARKFEPGYAAASDSTAAARYSPFKVHIGRGDGEQEIKAVDVTLPKGLVGRLAGIPYCGEAEIDAAAASSGRSQQVQASPSCSSESAVGRVTTVAGTGSAPLRLGGTAYLAGPYKGAPLSLAIVTPAVSGPFDLGTVVVRVALNVDPLTAQVHAVSDPIPDVFGGVKLDIRSIDVEMDRHRFMLNPTNCAAQATAGTISGGGANPADAAAWSTHQVSAPYRASGCGKLGFKPKLYARITGGTTRAKNPKIRVVVKARNGDANIARTALNLPHSLFLDQGHIKQVCTRVQLAAKQCPKSSIYGHAEASSPLLKQKLKGPVYLVSSKHKLPDLLADLRGQINIQLDGVISSKHGGLKTVFNNTPDVPLKSFTLNMRGGKKSLLQNSTNLCKSRQLAILNIKGQNGKKVKDNRFRLNIASCGSKRKHQQHKEK